MIAHSPKTLASFARKCLIIGFRPCQTHAIPPTNGSVRRKQASWVKEGQKEKKNSQTAKNTAYPCPFLLFSSVKQAHEKGEKTDTENGKDGK